MSIKVKLSGLLNTDTLLDVTLHQVRIREHISRTDCALTEGGGGEMGRVGGGEAEGVSP